MSRWRIVARAALVPPIAVALGCARTERAEHTDSTGVVATDSVHGRAAETGSMESGTGSSPSARDTSDTLGSAPATSATLAAARTRLQAEARRLDRAVRARDLAGAAGASLRVRDAAVALTGRTAELPAARTEQIEAAVTELIALTEKARADAAAGSIESLDEDAGGIRRIVERVVTLSAPGR